MKSRKLLVFGTYTDSRCQEQAGIRYPLLYWKLAVFQFVGSKIPGRLGTSHTVGNHRVDLCQLQGSSAKRIYDLLEK